MRSANLLNDFAFKYVFGEDSKEANDALKSLLTVFLERSVNDVVVKNSEMVKDYSKMKRPRLDYQLNLMIKQLQIQKCS